MSVVAKFKLHGIDFEVDNETVGDTLEQLSVLLEDEKLGEAAVTVEQQALATAAVASTPPSGATAATPPPGSAGGAPQCPQGHGPMNDLQGRTNKAGQPYKFRYYCSDFKCRESRD